MNRAVDESDVSSSYSNYSILFLWDRCPVEKLLAITNTTQHIHLQYAPTHSLHAQLTFSYRSVLLAWQSNNTEFSERLGQVLPDRPVGAILPFMELKELA